ncbi:NAD(P)/FAD-dependent oxidoreductase [Nocardia thraciensis]
MNDSVIVVGAALAGFSVVHELRAQGYAGAITVVGEETHPPYDRPPLSKEFLHGDIDIALGEGSDYTDPRTRWLLGRRATGILRGTTGVTLDDGTELTGRSLVLATGARARRLPGSATLRGVHTLRTVDDAREIRETLRTVSTLVVVGAGLIGAEIAATAAGFGIDVTIVEIAAEPLATVFGPTIASLCADLHAANGVRLRTGVAVERLLGSDRVRGVRLSDGAELPADAVVAGIGAVPNTEWARDCGLRIDGGFRTDARCRTGVPGIYAIGDCARAYDERSGTYHRHEHWAGATVQARIAAAAILDIPQPRPPAPYFWSRQYGRMIQFAGVRRPTDDVRFVDGDRSSPSCAALYERDGTPVAIFALDNPRTFTRYRKQIDRAAPLPVH